MPINFSKPIQSIISTKSETPSGQTIVGSSLNYTLCDRTILSTVYSNYFLSFNLPHTSAHLTSGSTLASFFPELYQLNVDKIVIMPIPASYYNDMIDGRSVTWSVPQKKNATSMSAKTIVSSTYNSLEKREENVLLGKNVAFLFSDQINRPYTGTTDGGAISHAGNSAWNTSSYLSRPPAVSYQNLQSTDINTDQRSWVSVKKAVTIPENYPTTTNQGYNYDIPVGFAALDKGFLVLTHPQIINNIPWHSGRTQANVLNTTSATTKIWFNQNSGSTLSFYDLNIKYKTSVVCMALPGEFYFTNNPSWNYEANLSEYTMGTNNFDSTYITEIGLYNTNDELVALAKLDRAKEKGYTGVFTFNLELDV